MFLYVYVLFNQIYKIQLLLVAKLSVCLFLTLFLKLSTRAPHLLFENRSHIILETFLNLCISRLELVLRGSQSQISPYCLTSIETYWLLDQMNKTFDLPFDFLTLVSTGGTFIILYQTTL